MNSDFNLYGHPVVKKLKRTCLYLLAHESVSLKAEIFVVH